MNGGMRCWPRWLSTWPPGMMRPAAVGGVQVLRRAWFPAELRIQRAEALVWAPAAFRKHGVYLSGRDLEAA
jgi:hypothetical protein